MIRSNEEKWKKLEIVSDLERRSNWRFTVNHTARNHRANAAGLPLQAEHDAGLENVSSAAHWEIQ